jgi:glycosyltransferase involved in cell wall biosynthesis
MGVSPDVPPKIDARFPYILYCGRIDPGKGCDRLFRYFELFQRQHPGPLQLLLSGNLQMKLPKRVRGLRYLGYVPEEEKMRLMVGAQAVVVPSPNESLSLITLEAMAVGTPVLAYGRNPVLREHIEQSDGGFLFSGYESFRVRLGTLLANAELRTNMGLAGQRYVRANYAVDVVKRKWFEEVERCAGTPPAEATAGAERPA